MFFAKALPTECTCIETQGHKDIAAQEGAGSPKVVSSTVGLAGVVW
jgi:hypothetical protein